MVEDACRYKSRILVSLSAFIVKLHYLFLPAHLLGCTVFTYYVHFRFRVNHLYFGKRRLLLLPPQGFGPEAKTRGGTLGSPTCTCIHTKGMSRKYYRNELVVWEFSRFDETRRARWSRVMVSVTCN